MQNQKSLMRYIEKYVLKKSDFIYKEIKYEDREYHH